MLMPADLRDWLPENHIARFIVELVERLARSSFRVNDRGSGDAQYPPSMLAALLIYCYATGRFSSRRIEEATYNVRRLFKLSGCPSVPQNAPFCTPGC